VRAAFQRHGGVEVDTQGDSFFYAFSSAKEAGRAATDAQAALVEGPTRIRIGIHTGEPLVTEEGYVGIDVHRAARIMSAGHGGQVLMSQATRELLDDSCIDLGEHRLKDLMAPQRLWQLGPGEFPPPRTLHQTNLPIQATPLVGRERDLTEAGALLKRARLLTLSGPGGSGKTRLALQLAADSVDEFPDGVWWVPLAAISEPALVLPAVAQTLGTRGDLHSYLRTKRLLLVLDNLEQVIDCASDIGDLLSGAPGIRVLTTSRELLRVAGEHEFPVGPLAEDEAVALFVERAVLAEPRGAVREICRRLDCLPLAIELAAARTTVLPPSQLLVRLSDRLGLLTGGRRDLPARQRTLRATIEWSHDLLRPSEQVLLRDLGVFAGGFTLAAAEAIVGADLDTLQALVERSLVRRSQSGRFGLLETIREFARERLEAHPSAEQLKEAHARFYLALAEAAGSQLARRYAISLCGGGGACWTADSAPIIEGVVADMVHGVDRSTIAAAFHGALCDLVVLGCDRVREETGLATVVLSGGVFVNPLLAESAHEALVARRFTVLLPRDVPCNDGGLALGQAYVAACALEEEPCA